MFILSLLLNTTQAMVGAPFPYIVPTPEQVIYQQIGRPVQGINFNRFVTKAAQEISGKPWTQELALKFADPSYRALNPNLWFGGSSETSSADVIINKIGGAVTGFYQQAGGVLPSSVMSNIDDAINSVNSDQLLKITGVKDTKGNIIPEALMKGLFATFLDNFIAHRWFNAISAPTNFSNIIRIFFADYAKILLIENPTMSAQEIIEASEPFVDELIATYQEYFTKALAQLQGQQAAAAVGQQYAPLPQPGVPQQAPPPAYGSMGGAAASGMGFMPPPQGVQYSYFQHHGNYLPFPTPVVQGQHQQQQQQHQ